MTWQGLARREITLLLALVGVAAMFSASSPFFFSAPNLNTILKNSLEPALVGLGMSFVLATGGIDIAVGGVLGIGAIIIGWSVQASWPVPVIVLLGPCLGVLLGLVSGGLIVAGRIPPIIATLGLYGVYRTTIFLLLGGSWISGLSDTLGPLVNGTVLGIPLVAAYVAVLYLLGLLILRWLPLGTAVLAVGGNEQAARLAGVHIQRVKLFVYGFTGLLTGLSALLYVARYRNVETSTGGLLGLDAIVAAVLGGTSVLGGRANLTGTLLGVLLIRTLQNGFVLVGVPSLWEQVITGVLLILVLVLDSLTAGGRWTAATARP
jgi:AI-2 transport system permease protein